MKYSRLFKWCAGIFLVGILLTIAVYLVMDYQQEPLEMNEEARVNAPGELVALSNGLTHYRVFGPPDGDLVVLIHGGMVSGMYAWKNNAEVLSRNGYRVLLYDLYGRGYSDRLEEEYTPELFFRQFKELLDFLHIRGPFYLAGLSMGSMPAIEFTRKNPSQVKKLMLLSPAARGKFRLNPVLKVPYLSDFLLTVYWYPRTVNNQMQEFYQPEKFPEYEQKLKEMIRYKGYKASNYSTWLHTLTYNMENQLMEVGKNGTPVALVLGKHDPYVQPDEAKLYQQLIPEIKIFEIEEAGHVVNFEQADEINQLMIKFFSDN